MPFGRAGQLNRHDSLPKSQIMKMSLPSGMTRAVWVVLLLLGSVSSGLAQGEGLARTPPMGWNSWNHFECKVTATDVRSAADAIAANGMKAAGYIYVNID